VKQMTLTDSDGKQTNLTTNSFDAYITTTRYHLNLPGPVLRSFVTSTGASPSDDGLDVFRLPDDFSSTFTITLDDGLVVEYDTSWLKNVSNNSPISSSVINDPATNQTISLLGSAFLSQLYFIANYDAQPPSFHLAQALPSAPYVFTEPLCPNTDPVAAKKHKVSSFAASGLAGAIVGGVVGGLGLLFVLFWGFRKCMQRRTHQEQARQNMKGKSLDSESTIDGSTLAARPSNLEDIECGDNREMATFAFDFNSSQHQSYSQYLNAAAAASDKQKKRKSLTPPLSRTYTSFIRQISQENLSTSREVLNPKPITFTPGASSSSLAPPPIQTQAPQINIEIPDEHEVSPMTPGSSLGLPVPQFATVPLSLSHTESWDSSRASPITPATGVPLLLHHAGPARLIDTPRSRPVSSAEALVPPAESSSAVGGGRFYDIHLNNDSTTSFADSVTAYNFAQTQQQNKSQSSLPLQTGADPTSFRAREAQLRGVGGLNVNTEFAPPPKSKIFGAKGSRKEGLLRKVFPPSS
jgi:hypothetical protein